MLEVRLWGLQVVPDKILLPGLPQSLDLLQYSKGGLGVLDPKLLDVHLNYIPLHLG